MFRVKYFPQTLTPLLSSIILFCLRDFALKWRHSNRFDQFSMFTQDVNLIRAAEIIEYPINTKYEEKCLFLILLPVLPLTIVVHSRRQTPVVPVTNVVCPESQVNLIMRQTHYYKNFFCFNKSKFFLSTSLLTT